MYSDRQINKVAYEFLNQGTLTTVNLKGKYKPEILEKIKEAKEVIKKKRAKRFNLSRKPQVSTLQDRLNKIRLDRLRSILDDTYRIQSRSRVYIVYMQNDKTVKMSKSPTFNRYGRAGNIVSITIFLSPDWHKDVEQAGLALIDNLFTMSAEKLEDNLYKASWLEQGRGYDIKLISGYIAINGNMSYHSTISAEDAKTKLERKIKRSAKPRLNRIQKLEQAVKVMPDLVVSIDDVKAVGACDSGIRSFQAKHNLSNSTTLDQLWAIYQTDKRSELLLAMIYAVKSSKKLAKAT